MSKQSSDNILTASGLGLQLKAAGRMVTILEAIDFSLAAGETVSIVGPSGSGKTSLLMLLAGLEQPTAGHISCLGMDYESLDEDGLARFRRDHIGIVFQSFHLIPTMTALENTALPLELGGKTAAFQQAEAALERVGLSHRFNHYPGQLSGGEQQRVALARAFVARPRLILADEPTGNLDGKTGAHVIDSLFSMTKEAGSSLILITHDPTLATRCNHHFSMTDGHLTKQADGNLSKANTR